MADANASSHTVAGLDVPTPSSGPSMSPNTVPSDAFHELSSSVTSIDGTLEDTATDVPDYAHGTDPIADAVHDLVKSLAEDAAPRLVLAESRGIGSEVVQAHILPLLQQTRNTQEIVLIDLHSDDIVAGVCSAVYHNPTITCLALVNSEGCRGLSREGISFVASLVYNCRHLHALSLINMLYPHVSHAMQLLGEAIVRSRSLRVLSLEANAIDDDSLLPLAQGLAGQRSLLEIRLDSNTLSYKGLEIMSEVMMYNEVLEDVSLNKNRVRCVTDLWEGYFIHEQCRVNRELALLGRYARRRHHDWPSLWRRKMRRMWFVLSKLNARGFAVADEDWERVLQHLDPRGYVEQQVKLWMKLDPPQQVAPQILRHT